MILYDECPICENRCKLSQQTEKFDLVDCYRCSKYRISKLAQRHLSGIELSERQVANASSWLRQNPGTTIRKESLTFLTSVRAPLYTQRAELLLRHIAENVDHEGEEFAIDAGAPMFEALSVAWCTKPQELALLLRYMEKDKGWITYEISVIDSYEVTITAKGYEHLDTVRQTISSEPNGFCAMWFGDEVADAWTDAIAPAIEESGYRAIRIDGIHHNNRIDDEIMAQIRRSRFVVADFTGQRGGVYFEAGFAVGLGIPVIWTIREDDLENVHFDNRQYNFILWDTADLPAFKKALGNRIQAILGVGPIPAPDSTEL